MESNWTHVPHGYKNETDMIKKTLDRIEKQKFVDQNNKHDIDHLKMENTVLNSKITKQKHLLEDFKDLVDMFATGNVDLRFYKRVIKDYLDSIEYSHKD
jgi:hypothetical protein